tara:strand:- start:126 stop:272 length:147 start_codon:yes stop_codon:yes gene_type:complete
MKYQVIYQQPKKKGFATQKATFFKIEDAVFWEELMKKNGCKDFETYVS